MKDWVERSKAADRLLGFPNAQAERALPHADTLPVDDESRVYLVLPERIYSDTAYAALIAGVEEISQAEYLAVVEVMP